jgi:hypothetical protein
MASGDATWRQLLSELAQADAPQVIEEARAGARARARSALEDALVDELLRAAAERLSPRAPDRATSAEPEPEPEAGDAWWVYCVIGAEGAAELAEDLAGIEGPVEALVVDELAALVSRVPLAEYGDEQLRRHLEDIVWLERTARAHEAVQDSVMRRAALVPLRMCTIYKDPERVRRVLQANARAFAANLAAVQDCAEWGVKVFLDPDHARPHPTPGTEAQASSGTQYLASRQRERDQAKQIDELSARCVEEVHEAVAAVARQDRVNPVQRPEAHGRKADMILNGAYLVQDSRMVEVEGTVSELQERWGPEGLLVELTGPWPPYNFVSESAGMIS